MEQKTGTSELTRSDFPETFVSIGCKNLRDVNTLVYREIAKRIPLEFNNIGTSGSEYKEEDLMSVWAKSHLDVERAHEMSHRVGDNLDYLILANAS